MTTVRALATVEAQPPAVRGRPGRGLLIRQGLLIRRGLPAVPKTIAAIARVSGALSLLDALWPHHWHVLSAFSPLDPHPTRAAAQALVAVSGVLLLRVAAGLRRAKRSAWLIAVAAGSVLTLVDLARAERRPVEGTVTAVLLVSLIAARSRFTARDAPRNRWFAAGITAQFLGLGFSYGLLMLWLPGHVPPATSARARITEVAAALVGQGGTVPITGEAYADTFHITVLALGLLAVAAGVVVLLRPYEPVAALSADDEHRVRTLLQRHGRLDSLGYFALRRDKAVVWSASGKAAVTYRVVSGVALASGDPIGDPEAWPGAIRAYRELVERYGWTPAVMGCSELGATVFRREYGLTALELGDEAVLERTSFRLDGRAMRCVRQACTRVTRAGYRAEVRRVGELGPDEIAELRAAAAAWRGDAVERGYSMALSRLGDPSDPECVVVTARRGGVLCGFLHFVPWGNDGLSLDLMRRDRTCDNGLNEFLIVAAMQACAELGVERVSLNFAVFRDVLDRGAHIGAGPVLRAWRRVLLLASRYWQIESLYRFNAKFQPRWQPRFISYPAARDLPRIAVAALRAEAFLVPPRALTRVLGRG